MRDKQQILQDATRKTEKDVTIPQFSDKLTLLTLEVLVDIRDSLTSEPAALSTLNSIRQLLR